LTEYSQRIEKRLGACNNTASGTRYGETSVLTWLTRAGASLAIAYYMLAALAQIPDDFPPNIRDHRAIHRLQTGASRVSFGVSDEPRLFRSLRGSRPYLSAAQAPKKGTSIGPRTNL
jgi:hypothetical protein